MPPRVEVTLLADREYGSVAMTRFCLLQGWHFCLRVKRSRWLVQADGQKTQIGSLTLAPGGCLFIPGVHLPALPERALSLYCGWSRDDKDEEPWYILSDLPADHWVLAAYAVRLHIEEIFRDFNEFGFRLETTHLRDPERVSRLLLCVCLAHVWLMNAFAWAPRPGSGGR